ncbi:MAG: bifunctional riboflavin kinase/FAD synthetase, partial [Cellvibrionales bacterium]|nr:bifunctional riboflavin kinase/FAD synthetase [Cellvibrionales bacterium]
MEVIRGLDKITDNHKGCVATIGAFDGVHLGHQSVLKRLTDISYDLGLPSLVITLEPLPREFFSPQCAPPRLMSFDEKALIMGNLGIDRILRIDFNKNLSRVSAENFIKDIFYKSLGIQYIIIGDDLRFGHLRKGDFQLLKTMGKNLGFQVEATKTLEVSGSRVSSTRIRNAVASSDFLLSETLLGRPYFIHGK